MDTWLPVVVWIPLVLAWIVALADIFRRGDLSGRKKLLWVAAVLLVPAFGVFLYFLVRPDTEVGVIGRPAVRGGSLAVTDPTFVDELERLAELRASGQLSDAEYDVEKHRLLG